MDSCYIQAAVDIARESGALLADCFARGECAEAKGPFDLVTETDRAVEAVILGRPFSACTAEDAEG